MRHHHKPCSKAHILLLSGVCLLPCHLQCIYILQVGKGMNGSCRIQTLGLPWLRSLDLSISLAQRTVPSAKIGPKTGSTKAQRPAPSFDKGYLLMGSAFVAIPEEPSDTSRSRLFVRVRCQCFAFWDFAAFRISVGACRSLIRAFFVYNIIKKTNQRLEKEKKEKRKIGKYPLFFDAASHTGQPPHQCAILQSL